MRRSGLHRSHLRRFPSGSGSGGVTSITINDGTPITGAIDLYSPMASDIGGNAMRIDNGNVKNLTDAATIVGVDCDTRQSYRVTINGARTMSIPVASLFGGPPAGEKITFTIQKTNVGDTLAWTGGAAGYAFANVASGFAVTLAQFNAAFAAAGAGQVVKIAWEWDGTLDRWLAVGMGAYYL